MPKFQKLGIKILLAMFAFVTIAGSLFYVRPAQAIPVEIIANAPSTIDKIVEKIGLFLKTATVNIAVQSLSYLTRRIAYDSAVWLASGGKGETPFSHQKDFGSYLKDVADNTAGVAIEALGQPYGLNLCKIPDPKIDLAMRIGLTNKYVNLNQTAGPGVTPPNCTWSSFQNDVLNTDNWQSQFGGSSDIAKSFNVSFSTDQTDLGILTGATQKIERLIADQTAAEALQRQEGNGYKPKTTLISGDIVTPAKNIAEEAQAQNPSVQQEKSEKNFGAVLSTGLQGAIMPAFSLFINTLASKMMENYQTKGMFPFGVCVAGHGGADCKNTLDTLTSYEGSVVGGRQAAQALFADLLTPPNVQIDQYTILANFSNCPATSPGPENCVADGGLAQAAQETSVGKPITVADALAKNWLHGEWKLISPERAADQTDTSCYSRAYCYANIAKLRKARVLPLGFEIAALNSNPDKPWTLKQVVDGFNDCNFIKDTNGNVVGVDNDPVNKPFCHLIDPNWVLKAPPSKCNFLAFGATPFFTGTPNRTQECADLSTCVAYDKDGNCATQGYCTREKNSWKIDAAKCDSQYRTCRSFTDSAGKNVSYLYRTLDTGFCTQDNVGCAQYSLKQDNAGNWANYSQNDLSIGENSAIYFNNKISTNCSAGSDGCSSFQTASTSDKLYLRQAPYYLGCYDTDTSTLAIDRPQTAADLNRLTQNPKCNNYSAACIADEVNCNWYAPISYAGDSIPGKFTPATVVENQIVWNDQCDKRCVGYSSYREMPSNYSNGQNLAYIIPSSGSRCNAVDEGCASFTNLSTTTGGLEKVEHFSYLRPCILPDPAKQKNFYTYEGSVVGGYQLKGFILEKDTDGSPKYFYNTDADAAAYAAICSEALYKSGAASPDCRQFNDEQGAVYYKLLSKTIAVSGSCAPYRLNDIEFQAPGKCFQNGEYRDGQCFYYGLPGGIGNTAGTSRACAAEVNSCRAYKGNAGNNVRNVFSDNFEGQSALALAGWGPAANISQSLESTHAGEHSLSYNGASGAVKSLSLNPGRSYDLSFWAKGGAGASVTVTLENGGVSALGVISVGDTWQFYHLGPVELGGAATSTQLKFAISGRLFLDNVSLKEVADYLYLVKNTLKVDPVCDSNLNDNLPGEALGCSEYRNPNNTPIYLTKFTSLCREKAIGCTALYDTRKTPNEPGPRAYNVWLAGAAGNISKTIGGQSYNCQIPVGQSGCYINVVGASLNTVTADGGIIVTSTIFVPSDTPSTTPVYLVANQQATCNPVDLGCMQAGRLVSTPTGPKYETTLVKNDPALYDTTLCQSEAVGCNAYSSISGALYFKDPATVGQKICSYRDNVSLNGTRYSGWFWKGVGKCAGTNQFCSADSDCSAGTTCAGKDEQPCYPNYLQSGNNYGLWSYGVTGSYDNFVGECPATQNGCTEFVDHNENNKVYNLINDDRLKTAQTNCNGQVSENAGCILFDKTDSPNKLWNTAASYAASGQQNNNLVTPVSAAANDANIILKVDRDRECGEWLQCRSSHRVFDAQSGNYKEICDDIGRCNKSPESADKSDITNCANWVASSELTNQVLTEDAYRNRNTDWRGQDFSGYSILNTYPPEELSEVNFSNNSNSNWRLAKKVSCGGGANCSSNINTGDFGCLRNSEPCGRGNAGICVNSICLSNPDGSTADVAHNSIGQSCRAYPEETSPFPNTEAIDKSSNYTSVNLCNETIGFTVDKLKAMGCDCDYNKVSYGDSITKYWNFNTPNASGTLKTDGSLAAGIVSGICAGGEKSGSVCGADSDCVNGSCQKLGKQTRLVGWHGYCIEPDISRPLNAEPNSFACLTWFPIDTIMGVPDINSQHVEAGFQASSAGGKYYCLAAKGNQQQAADNTYSYDELLVKDQRVAHTDDSQDREKRRFDVTSAIYQNEIDYIKIVANGNGAWFPNGVGTFYIRNGLVTKYNGPNWSIVGKDFPAPTPFKEETATMPFGRYIMSDGTNKKQWVMRYDDGEGNGPGNYQYADPSGKDIQLPFLDLLISSDNNLVVVEHPDGTTTTCGNIDYVNSPTQPGRDNYEANCLGTGVGISETDDGCGIRVLFKDNGQLDRVNFVCLTGDYSDNEKVTFDVYAGLREPCTYVAQTEDAAYTSAGWTDRLWKNSDYKDRTLNYPNSLPSQPFGSLGMSSLAPNQLVNIFTHYDKTTFDPLPAVVGSPYSCSGVNPAPRLNCLETNVATLDETKNGVASGNLMTEGKLALSNIFIKLDSVWSWGVSGNYAQNKSSQTVDNTWTQSDKPYNLSEYYGSASQAPKIHPLGTCKPGGKCLETNTDGFTLNGKSSGDLVFPSSVASVNLKFFAFADKNQMPIKKLQVDWGDGTNVSLDGYFRNQRGAVNGVCGGTGSANTCFVGDINTKQSCTSGNDCRYLNNCFAESVASNFGQIADKTCDNAYFRFDHVYQCLRDGAGWTNSCPDSQTQAVSGGCCIFKPKVQVKDNWGWCNGTTPSGGATGFYEKDWGAPNPRCSAPIPPVNPWTLFDGGNGRIIVAPQ